MRTIATPLALACAASFAVTPAPAQVPAVDSTAVRLLAAHNGERLALRLPPLAWDPLLASSAAAYGPSLAMHGLALPHSPRATRPGQRENLWAGSAGAYSPEQMVGTWIAERRFYRPGIFPDVSTSGNWIDVAHYTTMVWPTTTRVGCAIHRGGGFDYLICRYSPPGNIDGKPLLLSRLGERG